MEKRLINCDYVNLSSRFIWDNKDKCLVTDKKVKAGTIYAPAFTGFIPFINGLKVENNCDGIMYVNNGFIIFSKNDYTIRVFDKLRNRIVDHVVDDFFLSDDGVGLILCMLRFDGSKVKFHAGFFRDDIRFIIGKSVTGLFEYNNRYTRSGNSLRNRLSVGMSNRKYKFVLGNKIVFCGYALLCEFWGIAFDDKFNIMFVFTYSAYTIKNRVSYLVLNSVLANYYSLLAKNRVFGEVVEL